MTNNEMIANYMEYPGDGKGLYFAPDSEELVSADDLPYHSSWIWLMEVFNKLADELLIGHEDPPDWTDYCEIRTFSKRIGVRINGFPLHKEETLLLSAYAAVVEAIKFITEEKTE